MSTDIYDAFMLDHAARALPPGLHLAADLHMVLSEKGASQAAIWDMIGGALLEAGRAVSVADRPIKPAPSRPYAPAISVRDILETDLDRLKWRRTLTQAVRAPTGVPDAHFMRLKAGQSIPRHGHSTLEATVVMRGALAVDEEIYDIGDLMLGAPGDAHKPAAHGDKPCVCLVARGERPFWRLT